MRLSPGAILLGLAAVRQGGVPARAVAECFGDVGHREVPDDQMALQRELCNRAPTAKTLMQVLTGECVFLPVQCPDCGARLRAHACQLDPGVACPVCDSPLLVPRNAAAFVALDVEARRAAESERAYIARGTIGRFAHFELLRLIGAGGCGKVYEARNLRTGLVSGLKILQFLPLESRRQAFRRLIREVRFVVSIEHRNIVPVRDVGLGGGVPYIEMELMPGGSLEAYVARRGPLPWPEACRYLLEGLSALAASHEQGVIHSDLKPANILLDGAGCARVTDFGLSRFINETSTTTTTGRFVGSPHFMAPEQWMGLKVSPLSDIYAMGLIAYYLMTGSLALEGANAMALLYKHLHVPVPDARDTIPQIPILVAQAIQKAAAKDPGDRFRSADDFAAALREVVQCSCHR